MFKQDTFQKIYDSTFHDVSKYVVCHCHNIDDVNDIIQNIYYDVLRKSNKKSIRNINSYVMIITRNKVKDYYRFSYRDKAFVLKEENNLLDNYPDDIDIEESFQLKYDADLVWQYLKRKNIIIFKVFYLYFNLGLSIKDISKELNISQSNTKNYLYRTLKELKRLGDNDE